MSDRYKLFVTIAAGTGMRRGEILGLTLNRVAFDFGTIRVDRQLARSIAIPRGARIPASGGAIAWHLFDRPTFELGRNEIDIPGSDLKIGIYTPERCIADSFRLRNEVGYELGRDALKEWLRRGGKPAAIAEMAERLPRARTPLLNTLGGLA